MKLKTYTKGKLYLTKQAIVTLSVTGLDYIKGGQGTAQAWSTSIGKCSGLFCCDQHNQEDIPSAGVVPALINMVNL